MADASLCRRLAAYVLEADYDALPAEVVQKAQALVTHNLAIGFGGAGNDQVRRVLDTVARREGVCTVLGQPFDAGPADAAFVNSVAMRALRMDDSILPSFCHCGPCVIPAALAFAQELGRSGRELLAAIVLGYEVIGRMAGVESVWARQYRSTSHLLVGFGVAAAVARLMRLDLEQTAGAIAHAGNLAAMIAVGIQDVQYGVVTRNGVFAAELGRCRAPFPEDALEGKYGFYEAQMFGARPSDEEIFAGLGERFHILTAVLKPHPCTASNLVGVEIVRRELAARGLTGEDVARVTVTRSSDYRLQPNAHSFGPFGGYHGGMYEATSSLPFALGALLAHGRVESGHFESPNAPPLRAAMQKVEIALRDDLAELSDVVEILTTAGDRIVVEGCRDHLPAVDSGALLQDFAAPILGEAQTADLIGAVDALPAATTLDAVTRALRRQA